MPETFGVVVLSLPADLELTAEELDDLKEKFRADIVEILEDKGVEEATAVVSQIMMPRPGGSQSY